MNAIRVLDPKTAELIAAGEVIEKPASVVKELVENAIDAGATQIFVMIEGGGIQTIVVRDNGCGISREDVPNAFLRHATSKITDASDLESIFTMGFRGEALASIAAVSKVTMTTRTAEDEGGTMFYLEGGCDAEVEDVGCPVGTEIRVENLFFNTPARLKFLKTDQSEGNAVAGYIEKLAVSRPDIAFLFQREGKEVLRTTGDGDLKSALWSVYGKDFASKLLPLEAAADQISVRGFVTEPSAAKSRRAVQLFFVNGRLFQSRACQAVVEEAMKGSLMSGLHPGCAVFIELPPTQVDVNVHPAKLEVRFAQERSVYRVIHMAVKEALLNAQIDPFAEYRAKKPQPVVQEPARQMPLFRNEEKKQPTDTAAPYLERVKAIFQKEEKEKTVPLRFDGEPAFKKQEEKPNVTPIMPIEPMPLVLDFAQDMTDVPAEAEILSEPAKESLLLSESSSDNEAVAVDVEEVFPPLPFLPVLSAETDEKQEESAVVEGDAAEEPADFRYLGAVAKTYLLAAFDEALLVVDQHAAHEKILFENLKRGKDRDGQMLLTPLVLEMSASESGSLLERKEELEDLGFSLEEFGSASLMVRQIPSILSPKKAEEALFEMAENFSQKGALHATAKALDWIYHSIACRAAVKAGDTLCTLEAEKLIERVLNDPAIRHCPHGRPVFFVMDKKEMEKRFGRI